MTARVLLDDDAAWPSTLAEAMAAFDDADDPQEAAYEWLRRRVRKGSIKRQAQRMFTVFMAWELWELAGLSCEAAFAAWFGLSRRTLFRWKDALGFVDHAHGDRIRMGRSQCASMAHGDRPSSFRFGEQLALPYFEPVAAATDRVRAELEGLLAARAEWTDEDRRQARRLIRPLLALADGRAR